jgi:hypothetical protein
MAQVSDTKLLTVLLIVWLNGGVLPFTSILSQLEWLAVNRGTKHEKVAFRKKVQDVVYRARKRVRPPLLESRKEGGDTYKHETILITAAGRQMLQKSVCWSVER